MALSALFTPKTTPAADPFVQNVRISAWAASTAYVVGQVVRSTALTNAIGTGDFYICTVAGTSNSTAPTWTTTGTTVSDNNVTWLDLGAGYMGDPWLMPNGFAATLTGLQPLPNQVLATVSYTGCLTATKLSATTAVDGTGIWFDALAKGFVASAPSYGFYCGTARGAWVSGQTSGLLLLNGGLITTTFVGGALTATGAVVAQSTLAVTGAATLSSTLAVTSNATVGGTLGVTGATTLSSTLAVTGNVAITGRTTCAKSVLRPVQSAVTALAAAAGVITADKDIVSLLSVVTAATYGWTLPTGVAGMVLTLINTAAYAGTLIPATGGTIDGLAANAGVTIAASKCYIAVCTAADTWTVLEAAKATAA